jgi:pullulanase-type alpha-1,6-glucosidase
VWAPTARDVSLLLFDDATTDKSLRVPMTLDPASGVWRVAGDRSWKGKFYLYEVEVFVPSTGKVEVNRVTDPYSHGLSMNSTRSQIVDLDDPALQPEGWADIEKPPLAAPEDAVIYELHVRDFSILDRTVPEAQRGTFAAFTNPGSKGMQHLAALAEAGLTHVHLLPSFDIATINEDKAQRREPDLAALRKQPPDSTKQQEAVAAAADLDGFNWGYDPFHYTVPEGSYSTDPEGPQRVREFRAMVRALNAIGLRAVMDVVYNHTSQSGQNSKSVLDRIVPGYYHRLSRDGAIETSTCCQNTATERAMMEKLMIDSAVTWARDYKVDGFRFDLMGHHMLSNMTKLRAALDALTLADDGVDGKAIVLYGEGWDFGEVANDGRGVNASQLNLAGSGIGSFNDRLRDAARGGNPFDDRRLQGFVTGLGTAPNGLTSAPTDLTKLVDQTRLIRLGLAGNLRDFPLAIEGGRTIRGEQVQYGGKPAGYAADPQETVNYVSAHDNETLFDKIQFAAPVSATMAERVRMNTLGAALVLLGQGVPFFHAGDDLLRSKSLDRDSYNSGDWFNQLDLTYQSNNWGAGLPPAGPNKERWPQMQPLLADPRLKAAPADIARASDGFRDMLRIRKSSPLFRLRTAAEIMDRVRFFNVDDDQIPGVIMLEITDQGQPAQLDARFDRIVVVFNATPRAQVLADAAFAGEAFELHPVQARGSDSVVKQAKFDAAKGAFTVPGRTAAVFVMPR